MRRVVAGATLVFALAGASARSAHATPSSNFWAPSTPGIQGYGVIHLTYDTYFGSEALYPVDTGLEIGVLPWHHLQAEVGFDLFYPTYAPDGAVGAPLLLNAKVGGPEGAWFGGSPAWSMGFYNVGFEEDVTDYNVFHAMIGKTFPRVGILSVGGYYGLNEDLLHSSDGSLERGGFMAGWVSPSIDVPLIDRMMFTWDVQTGENVLGGTGGGAYFYVTPAVDVLMGPVFFFDPDLQPGGSDWMWSMQVDVDVNLLGAK